MSVELKANPTAETTRRRRRRNSMTQTVCKGDAKPNEALDRDSVRKTSCLIEEEIIPRNAAPCDVSRVVEESLFPSYLCSLGKWEENLHSSLDPNRILIRRALAESCVSSEISQENFKNRAT